MTGAPAHHHRAGPGAAAREADRGAVGRLDGRLPGGRVPAALGGVERPVPRHDARLLARATPTGCAPWRPGWPGPPTSTSTTGGRRTPRSTSSPRTTASRCATWSPTSEKHNEANGEGNRDGTDNNRSWNCGVEGETDDEAVLALRHRQAANLIATLCLSAGVPMITAGDERGRTQRGNNNPYCQDNEISWVDWSADDAWLDIFEITRTALQIRRDHPALRQRHWFEGRPAIVGGPKDLAWMHPDGPRDDRRRLAGRRPAGDRDVRLRRPAPLPRPAGRAAARQQLHALAQRLRARLRGDPAAQRLGAAAGRSCSPPTRTTRSASRSRRARRSPSPRGRWCCWRRSERARGHRSGRPR